MKWVGCCWIFFLQLPAHAQEPKLVLPVGHTSSLSAAAFSPDGRYIVTASWDNTAKIWQAPEGRLLNEFKGHTASLTSAAFSADNKYIVTTSKDSTARIWEASKARLLYELKGHKDWVNNAVFSPDGKLLVTVSWDHTAKIWDAEKGKLLHTLKKHSGSVNTAVFSNNGKYILTTSKDNTAAVWLAASGSFLYTLKGHSDWVNAGAFSKNNKYIVTASRDGTARIWNTADGKIIRVLKGHNGSVNTAEFSTSSAFIVTSSGDSTAKIWRTQDGKLLSELYGHTGIVNTAAISADEKYVVTSGNDSIAKVWQSSNGRLLHTLTGHTGSVNAALFSPDSKYVLTASADNTGRIWNALNGELVDRMRGHISVVTSAVFSPDGQYMVTTSWDNTAKIWNASDGKLLSNLKGHSDWINSAAFSPDGKYIVTASSDNTGRIWTVPEGKPVNVLNGHTDWISSAVFSPDGKYIVTTSWDYTARIFNASDGQQLNELKGHSDVIRQASFSTDGKYIVTASWDHTAKTWNVADGKMRYSLEGHSDKIRTAAFSADGKYVVTSSWDSTARIWTTADGKLVKELKGQKGSLNGAVFSADGRHIVTTSMDNSAWIWNITSDGPVKKLNGHAQPINSVSYSADGKFIVTASWDNTAAIWNADEGKLQYLLKGHTGPLKSASYSPDGKYIVTTSEDNTLKKWDAGTGAFLYTFFAVDSTDYLAIDKDGHYDGTEAARKMLYYVCGNEIVDLEQFKDLSWEPGLVSKLTGANKEPITAKKITDINICNYAPVVEQTNRENDIHYLITPRRGGVGDIELYVNGKMVEKYDTASLVKKNGAWQLIVKEEKVSPYFVSGASNVVSVKATTREGMMLSRGAFSATLSDKKAGMPDMYLVSVGVSRYKGEKLHLRYASKDATDFTSAVTASAKKLLNTDGRQHVFTYNLNTEEGSRQPAKAGIQKLVDTIAMRATPDDIFIFFFAGHGILQAGQKNFFLLTADASTTELQGIEKDVAISTEELKEWLRKIKANKQLLILDACNSGQVVQQLQQLIGKREVPADQQRALENLKDKTGTFILSASASGQAAYESSVYGQGLLTYSLLSGIKLGTGLRENKFIDVTRWFNFACDNVKVLATEIGGRQDPQIIGNASFEIGMVDKEVVDNIQLSVKKNIFRSSRFIQDEVLLNDDLDMSYLVDRELTNASGRSNAGGLVFVADNPLVDAYSVRGRYSVEGNNTTFNVMLVKGQKEKIQQFELKGTAEKKEQSARRIVEMVSLYLNQLKKDN